MLKAAELGFRYPAQRPWILKNLSIQLDPGEIVGLTGPSGLGKTTLAKILAGYLEPELGQVTLEGGPLPKSGYCPVQLVFQNPELAVNPRWRIQQVLQEGDLASTELMGMLNISPGWLDRWPHELSGGELQRIVVARALGPRTRYLITDEMTTMLDASTQAAIWQAVLQVAQQRSLGLLVISHDAPLLGRLCHRIIDLEVRR